MRLKGAAAAAFAALAATGQAMAAGLPGRDAVVVTPDQPGLVGDADVQGFSVGLRVHGNRRDAKLAARARNPNGNLPAVRDKELAEHQPTIAASSPER